MEGTKG